MDSQKLNDLIKRYPCVRSIGADGEDRGHVMTGPMRLQWPALAQPKPGNRDGTGPLKYRVTLIAPLGTMPGALADTVKRARVAKFGEQGAGLRSPFRKQSEKTHLGERVGFSDAADAWFVAASANVEYPPTLVGPGGSKDRLPLDSAEFYPGVWVRAKLNAYAYNSSGNRGVSFGLLAMQKLADDDRLSEGSGDNAHGFDAVEGFAVPERANGAAIVDPFAV